jgi:hypothetical protein
MSMILKGLKRVLKYLAVWDEPATPLYEKDTIPGFGAEKRDGLKERIKEKIKKLIEKIKT